MSRRLMLLSLVTVMALGAVAEAANIIWVSDNKGFGNFEPNTPVDIGWVDLLRAQGHTVIYKNEHEYIDGQQYWRTLDANKIAELEAADLIILSRNADSGSYSTAADNEPNQWDAVTTPLISLSAHMSRAVSKWGWLNGTATTYAMEGTLKVVDPTHPIFAGVDIDPNGVVDAFSTEWNIDYVTGVTDAGNGTLLATRASDGLVSIAYWEAGVEFFPGSGKIAGGPRLLFIAGAGSKAVPVADGAYNLTAEGEKMFVNAVNFMLPPAEPTGPKVIYVTSVKDNNLDGVQDDISWKDWLEAEGYDVDFRPGYWSDPLDANEIAELDAADLIIASRGMATGDFDGAETPKWNGLTTPILCTNAWMIRNNRWKWLDSGTANKDAGSPLMLVTELDHPIFKGLPVDEDGLLDVLDPNAGSGNTSFLTNYIDPGNGTLLSISLGIYTTAWIVEWQSGVEYYPGAGEIAAGPRMLFMAGTQDDPYTDANGNIMPVGVFNLNETGQQLLRNIITYLLPKPPVAGLIHDYTFADGTADDSVGDADGTLVGGAAVVDGALLTTAQDQWMEMPGDVIDVNSLSEVTIACWYTPQAGANTSWSMLAYFGDSFNGLGSNGFFITSARGDDKSRAAISVGDQATPWASESGADGPEIDDGLLHFMVSTINATDITLYIDGVLISSAPLSAANKLSGVSNNYAYLAKGGYTGDPEWIGQIQEFSMYDRAITADEVAQLFAEGPK
jgi:hypothetical protein